MFCSTLSALIFVLSGRKFGQTHEFCQFFLFKNLSFIVILLGWHYDKSECSSVYLGSCQPCLRPVQSSEIGRAEHPATCCPPVQVRSSLAHPGQSREGQWSQVIGMKFKGLPGNNIWILFGNRMQVNFFTTRLETKFLYSIIFYA